MLRKMRLGWITTFSDYVSLVGHMIIIMLNIHHFTRHLLEQGNFRAAAMTLRTVLLSLQSLLSSAEPDDPQDAVVAKQV